MLVYDLKLGFFWSSVFEKNKQDKKNNCSTRSSPLQKRPGLFLSDSRVFITPNMVALSFFLS